MREIIYLNQNHRLPDRVSEDHVPEAKAHVSQAIVAAAPDAHAVVHIIRRPVAHHTRRRSSQQLKTKRNKAHLNTIYSLKKCIKRLESQIVVSENGGGRSSLVAVPGSQANGHSRMSSMESIIIALRRSASACSLRCASIFLGCAVSPNTVRNYEIRLAACIIAEARAFHSHHDDLFASCSSFAVSAHRLRADATNVAAFRGCSMQTCEVASHYVYDGRHAASLTVWPEAQVVNGKSTVDTFYLTGKQSDAVNSPFFRQLLLPQHEGKCIERWLTYTTDDGLDQRGVRARLGHTMEQRRYEYFIGFVCLCHALSNGAKKSLALADHLAVAIWQLPPYFSSIAK